MMWAVNVYSFSGDGSGFFRGLFHISLLQSIFRVLEIIFQFLQSFHVAHLLPFMSFAVCNLFNYIYQVYFSSCFRSFLSAIRTQVTKGDKTDSYKNVQCDDQLN